MMKRPAFQFYPADHLRDPSLRACTLAARGLWMDMLCLMHEGTPYGHLRFGAAAVGAPELARMVGETPSRVSRLLKELEANGVFSRSPDGTIYSRRMVRDEHIRTVRATAGSRGGRQTWKQTRSDDEGPADDLPADLLKQNGEQKGTPSSSSSSSTSYLPPTPGADGSAGDDRPLTVRLVVAANQGVTDAIGEQPVPLRWDHPDTLALAASVEEQGVPPDFAVRAVFTAARKASKRDGRQPGTMAYFRRVVPEMWARHQSAEAARATPQPEALPELESRRSAVPAPAENPFAALRRQYESKAEAAKGAV